MAIRWGWLILWVASWSKFIIDKWQSVSFSSNYIYIYITGIMVFDNGPGDLGSILGRVIPKTQKWYLMPPCLILNITRYGSRVKWSTPGKGVAPSPTPWCSSYRKGSLWITFDYGRQLTLYIYIYIYIVYTHTHIVIVFSGCSLTVSRASNDLYYIKNIQCPFYLAKHCCCIFRNVWHRLLSWVKFYTCNNQRLVY